MKGCPACDRRKAQGKSGPCDVHFNDYLGFAFKALMLVTAMLCVVLALKAR